MPTLSSLVTLPSVHYDHLTSSTKSPSTSGEPDDYYYVYYYEDGTVAEAPGNGDSIIRSGLIGNSKNIKKVKKPIQAGKK